MSMARFPQLHFDGDPGKTSLVVVPLPVPRHTWFDPGCRQVVQKGSTNCWPAPDGHCVVIVPLTNSGLWAVPRGPVMSPHTSGDGSRLMKVPCCVFPARDAVGEHCPVLAPSWLGSPSVAM